MARRASDRIAPAADVPFPASAAAPRLLIVDDDAVDRMAVRRALGRSGLALAMVQEAVDAASALELLGDPSGGDATSAPPFDCVLLDFELAGATGLDVLRAMGERSRGVPVVMLTGQSDPETAATLIREGAVDFLAKGAYTAERLEQAIRGAIRVARAERELGEGRERMAATLRSIADAVITLDASGCVTYLNPAAARLTGWPAEEARGRSLEEVAFVVAADSRGGDLRDALLHERVRLVLEGRGGDARVDMTLVSRDGAQLFVDATVTPLRKGAGPASGIVVALRDITARKQAEAALESANRALQDQATTLEQQAAELEMQFEAAQTLAEELERANRDLSLASLETRKSEARYRALVEASAQLVWATDLDGRVDELPGWEALTGQSLESARGAGWLDALHPDDRERSAAAWREAFSRGGAFETEYRVWTRDGSHRWHRARGVPVRDEAGVIREWVGTLTDVDDERRAEDARRGEADLIATLHRIGDVLTSELDVERLVQTVTDAATSLTGAQFGAFFYNVVDRQGDVLTLYTLSGAPREAFQDFGHPRATPVFAPTFHGTGIVRSDDITRDARYGRMPPHHGMPPGHLPVRSYLAVPVISRAGEVIGGLFFGHAEASVFTERAERLASGIASSAAVAMDNARLYDAERRARADAESANRAKADFLASMSHELRTPLNAIGGYAELVLEGIRGPVTDAQRADLGRIKRSQQHLLSLINDILNFAKLEAGRVGYDLRDVPLDRALGDMEALVAPQLREKALRYTYHGCDVDCAVRADPERLQQILLNLVSNAVKFTATAGRIDVDCTVGTDAVLVRMRDTGIGIPPEKLESIFEPFVQVRSSLTRPHEGTGLGLAISRDLARGMGGDLTAESTLGQGSTFTLTLPRG